MLSSVLNRKDVRDTGSGLKISIAPFTQMKLGRGGLSLMHRTTIQHIACARLEVRLKDEGKFKSWIAVGADCLHCARVCCCIPNSVPK